MIKLLLWLCHSFLYTHLFRPMIFLSIPFSIPDLCHVTLIEYFLLRKFPLLFLFFNIFILQYFIWWLKHLCSESCHNTWLLQGFQECKHTYTSSFKKTWQISYRTGPEQVPSLSLTCGTPPYVTSVNVSWLFSDNMCLFKPCGWLVLF